MSQEKGKKEEIDGLLMGSVFRSFSLQKGTQSLARKRMEDKGGLQNLQEFNVFPME